MKKSLIVLVFWGICAEALAYSIPWETISGSKSDGAFGWNYSYDIGFFDHTLMVDVDIYLVGDAAQQSLLDRWEVGIEDIWSTDRFLIPISFNVDWVSDNYDQVVTIHDGSSDVFNMLNWNTMGANGWGDPYQEEVAAHEFGHMLGLFDEYSGGAVDPDTGLVNTGGLMHTLSGNTLDSYYNGIQDWYRDRRADLVEVPLPPTIWLLGTALLCLYGFRLIKRNSD